MAATDTTVVRNGSSFKETAGGSTQAGKIEVKGGMAYVLTGNRTYASGDELEWRNDLVVSVLKETKADTFSVGDRVWMISGDQDVDTEGGNGDICIGEARKASTANDTHVEVGLNDHLKQYYPNAAQQTLAAGGGAITVTEYYSEFSTDAGGDAITLVDGVVPGQMKLIRLIVDGGGDGTLTPSNLAGGTTITFADAGDEALLRWDGSNWQPVYLGNAADGATKPALA